MVSNISFYGGETTGSIGKRNIDNTLRKDTFQIQTPQKDSVNFKGRDDEESSFGSTLFKGLVSIAVIVGALGLAHKANLSGKIKNGKLKNIINKANKITEPCYNICHKAKELGIKGYDTIKDFFSKKR